MPLPQAPQLACGTAGRTSEQVAGLPANLLISIGFVESGRIDPASGRLSPWPWTVNVDGAGHYFDDEAGAAAFARLAASAGAGDVDVGCFQISLEHHPGAFASIDAAFDPAGNAAFAARFLNDLKLRTGSWQAAIADYHSARPELGLPYQRRVIAAWQHLGGAPADIAALITLPGAGPPGAGTPDPSVILEAASARLVQVITMTAQAQPPVWKSSAGAWLPRVITP